MAVAYDAETAKDTASELGVTFTGHGLPPEAQDWFELRWQKRGYAFNVHHDPGLNDLRYLMS